MLFLNVPFHDKDKAKALGARWHADKKQWFVPDGKDTAPFEQWTKELGGVGPKRGGLYVDLVPQTAWYSNLRSELTKDEWELVKSRTFQEAGHVCEVCGGRGPKHPVECHERWVYDEKQGIQKLQRTIALCPACHEVTHIGLAGVKGRTAFAMEHLKLVNNMDDQQAEAHVANAWKDWSRRNLMDWRLNAKWLLDFVPLSDASKQKILDHNAGIVDREVLQKIKAHIPGWEERQAKRQGGGGDDMDDILDHLLSD